MVKKYFWILFKGFINISVPIFDVRLYRVKYCCLPNGLVLHRKCCAQRAVTVKAPERLLLTITCREMDIAQTHSHCAVLKCIVLPHSYHHMHTHSNMLQELCVCVCVLMSFSVHTSASSLVLQAVLCAGGQLGLVLPSSFFCFSVNIIGQFCFIALFRYIIVK